MVLETVSPESPSASNSNNELALYLAETSVGQAISTAIVETTKTITTRSIVTASPSSSQHAHYPALPSSSPPSLEAVSTTTTVTLPWTQHQELSKVHTSRLLSHSHEPLHLLPPSSTPSPMPLLIGGHDHQVLPAQTGQVTQPTAILSSLTDRGVSNESEMITSISGPASESLEHLPSLPLSSFDMDLSLQMVPTDNMEVETPESSVETTLNFSAQMQTLWSQMENYASTISDFENRLTLIAISNLQQSLQLQAKEQQRFSEKLQTLAENRAADFHRIHTKSKSSLELTKKVGSNKNLGELVIGLTKENSLLSDRLRSLEGLLEQREIKSTPESIQSTSSVEPPPATPLEWSLKCLTSKSPSTRPSTLKLLDVQSSTRPSLLLMSRLIANSSSSNLSTKPNSVICRTKNANFFLGLSSRPTRSILLSINGGSPTPRLRVVTSGLRFTTTLRIRFCNRTQRELVDNLFEESERAEGESVKAYAIRLQTILDDIDVPDHQGVVIFKRGVRHARAESCLDNTDKELTSISDCMKLLRTRQIRLDDPPVYQQRLKSRPASASTNTTSSRTTYSDVSTTSTPEQSQRHTRKSSKVGFRDQATLEGIFEALKTTQSNQQAFVAQIQHLTEALNKPPNPYFAAPVQHAMNFPYGYPPTYAPGLPPTAPQQPTTNTPASGSSQHATQPQSKPRPAPTPVMISSKPDDCTTSGAKVCGRCDRLGHGSVDCPRKFARCTTCHQIGHYAGEHAKSCSFCKQIGHTYSRCPSKLADKA
ncbi:hypothetical protein Ae201684P_003528 [Aphanomyces euteiches]|nr:hypothetical protein Ae201684P_003528 [Aphanomyces euteiches]